MIGTDESPNHKYALIVSETGSIFESDDWGEIMEHAKEHVDIWHYSVEICLKSA